MSIKNKVVIKSSLKDIYHFMVPNKAFIELRKAIHSKKLIETDVSIYCVILAHLNSKNYKCWLSLRGFSENLGLSVETVCTSLDRLKAAGFIYRDPKFKNSKSCITLPLIRMEDRGMVDDREMYAQLPPIPGKATPAVENEDIFDDPPPTGFSTPRIELGTLPFQQQPAPIEEMEESPPLSDNDEVPF